MKKLILSVGLMWVFIAQASPLYWMSLETSEYTEDESEGKNTASYAMYYCTVDAAAKLFKGSSVNAIEGYLKDNFESAKSMATTYDSVAFSDGEYQLLDYVNEAFSTSDYVAFALYGSDAYRVYGAGSAVLTPYGSLVFNEDTAASGSVGDWQQAVPEPTSGMLLLIGLAGIALKRKRNKV